MKKFYLLSLLICFINIAHTQPCLTQQNNITTNPSSPVNTDCNGTMLNTFDWRSPTYPINFSAFPNSPTIPSPFYDQSNIKLRHLWSPNFGPKDYQPEDGWEFIKSGFAPDVTNYAYIILYNKYTSVIRVLVALAPTQQDYEVVEVTLGYDLDPADFKPTAAFHPQKENAQALDKPSIPSISSSVTYPSTHEHFIHVDFPVEYDVCSCNLKSVLKVTFRRIATQSLSLNGRMVTLTRDLANVQAGNVVGLEEDFLTSVYSQGTAAQSGVHTFTAWQGAINQYNDLKNQKAVYQKQLDEFELLQQALKLATGPGKSYLDNLKVIKVLPITGKALTGLQIVNLVSSGVNHLNAPIKAKIDEIDNSIDLLGSVQLSTSEMAITGTLTTSFDDTRGIYFQNPGATRNAQLCNSDYPSYNETMGRFAVLTTPKSINGKKKYYGLMSNGIDDPAQTSGDPSNEYYYFNAEYTTRFDGNLDYVYNKAADINLDKTELWGAIQIKVFLPYMDRNVMISNMEEILVSDDGSQTALYQSPLMPISCLSNFVGHIKALRALDRSPLATDPNPDLHALDIVVVEERLKLVNFYEFNKMNSEGAPASALQVLTYKLEPEQVNSFQTPTTDYPENLEIGPETYTSNTTIYAWGNITIKGDILTANQTVNVTIIGGSITVEGDSKIGKRITLKVAESPFANCTPIDEYSQSLSAYCSSSSYKGSSVATRLSNPALISNQNPEPKLANEGFTASLYPNPSTGDITTLSINTSNLSQNLEISLLQPTGGIGEVIHRASVLEKGETTFNINSSSFAPGLYFVKINYGNEVKVLKLIIR